MVKKIWIGLFIGFSGASFIRVSSAADVLPYSTRTKFYSGWATNIQGDVGTVGMAGSSPGLGESFLDPSDNPAELAMTSNDANASFSGNLISDGNIQNLDHHLGASHLAVALGSYPWGIGVCYRSRTLEGQPYQLATDPTAVTYAIRTNDLFVSAARLFANDRLSIGATLILGQAEEQAQMPSSTFDNSGQAWAFGFGASWLFPNHLILGVNLVPAFSYQFSTPRGTAPPLANFLQTIQLPSVVVTGLGWVPNRFFKASASIEFNGTTANTALLRDENATVGESVVFEPRIGAMYKFLDFKEIEMTVAGGSYFESSRIAGLDGRLHLTASLAATVWILDLGLGIDTATSYRNYIFAGSLNVIRTLEKLSLLPPEPKPLHQGWFPNIFHRSGEGLRIAISRHVPKRDQKKKSPIEIALEIPGKIADALSSKKKKGRHPDSVRHRNLKKHPKHTTQKPRTPNPESRSQTPNQSPVH